MLSTSTPSPFNTFRAVGNHNFHSSSSIENAPPTIIYPRVFELRRIQAIEGVNLENLTKSQRGIFTLPSLHHVSKVLDANGSETYRVRICKACNSLNGIGSTLELGTYVDIESALLVNDAHEIGEGRFHMLHLLTAQDKEYIKLLKIRKKGIQQDKSLVDVLHERLIKEQNRIKKLQLLKPPEQSNLVSGSISLAQHPPAVFNATTVPLNSVGGVGVGVGVGIMNRTVGNNNNLTGSSSARDLKEKLLRKKSLSEHFKRNVLNYYSNFLRWDFFDSQSKVDEFFISLCSFITSYDNSEALFNCVKKSNIPRASILSLISSCYPASSQECLELIEVLKVLIPQDVPSAREFRDSFEGSFEELSKLDRMDLSSIVIDGECIDNSVSAAAADGHKETIKQFISKSFPSCCKFLR